MMNIVELSIIMRFLHLMTTPMHGRVDYRFIFWYLIHREGPPSGRRLLLQLRVHKAQRVLLKSIIYFFIIHM
jgi:hypothetical protein